jgi:hypothetical protein
VSAGAKLRAPYRLEMLADVRQFTTLCCRVEYTGETNLRAQRNYSEAGGVIQRRAQWKISMLELTIAFIAAFSASIFLAHAVEAYLAR